MNISISNKYKIILEAVKRDYQEHFVGAPTPTNKEIIEGILNAYMKERRAFNIGRAIYLADEDENKIAKT